MTPLARRMCRELVKPIRDQALVFDQPSLRSRLVDFHCFEITDVWDNAVQAGGDWIKFSNARNYSIESKYLFLPFPRTWVEINLPEDDEYPGWWRQAFFLESLDNKNDRVSINLLQDFEDGIGNTEVATLSLAAIRGGNGSRMGHAQFMFGADPRLLKDENQDLYFHIVMGVIGALMIINTRSGFNKRTFAAHAGLQREMVRGMKMVGKFPLHSWTKITLLPHHEAQVKETEAHLTGQRCLHYVRQHLRPSTGALVAAHARGNPALGIRQSYYNLPKEHRHEPHRGRTGIYERDGPGPESPAAASAPRTEPDH